MKGTVPLNLLYHDQLATRVSARAVDRMIFVVIVFPLTLMTTKKVK
jgi:hypothetical protein